MRQLGIDIGATGIKGALVDLQTGDLIGDKIKLGTPKPAYPKEVARTVSELIDMLEWNTEVGCGFPAIVQSGICKSASNIPKDWIGKNIEDYFQKKTGLPFTCANDADLAGLAELMYGDHKDLDKGVTVFITLGTGIGSALFVDGSLIPNTEMGHLPYQDSIIERYASNNARKENNYKYEEWCKHLNELFKLLDRLFCPHHIILGGGVSKRFSLYEEYIDSPVPIAPATLMNNAGIIGAAVMAARNLDIA